MADLNDPLALLKVSLTEPVLVRVADGAEVRGDLVCFDKHVNIILSNAREEIGGRTREFSSLMIRGDSVVFVTHLDPRRA